MRRRRAAAGRDGVARRRPYAGECEGFSSSSRRTRDPARPTLAPMSPENPAPVTPAAKPPERFQSFTGPASVRYPAPDVARGFMLLLIALANVVFWVDYLPEAAGGTVLDQAWIALRGALVDRRSYPLFAMLFGFGLATMARRRIEAAMRAAEDALPPGADTQTRERHLARARETATVDARRLIRRRGLWMILFGAVHGTIFAGDIIGTYGIIAAVFAGTVVRRKRTRMLVVGIVMTLVCAWSMSYMGWAVGGGPEAAGITASESMAFSPVARATPGPSLPISNLIGWVFSTFFALTSAMTIPATFLGVRLADSDLMSRPNRHRRALLVGGAAALIVGAAGSVLNTRLTGGAPIYTMLTGSRPDPQSLLTGPAMPVWLASLAPVIDMLTGLVGACGWLALLAAWAGPGTGAPLRGAHWLLSAVGRRSMTVYIGQTVLFALVFGALLLTGAPAPGEAVLALIAVVVWAVLAGACAWMERSGRTRGPLEILLRHAVAASARRR